MPGVRVILFVETGAVEVTSARYWDLKMQAHGKTVDSFCSQKVAVTIVISYPARASKVQTGNVVPEETELNFSCSSAVIKNVP